jgi:hypothetical protein
MGYSPLGRPILGPLVLVAAGGAVAVVPLRFADLLALVGGGSPVLGIGMGSAIALCGIGVHALPEFSTEIGAMAMALSILSIFGTLGGLLVGLLLGLIGGNLCIAWQPAGGE